MVINVTEWLDETTEKFPDKIAISDENKQITFKKFRDSSISLAEKIIDFGAYKKPIAIVLRKSADTLIAFMGVAYSGNFYTVIDLDMPSTRKRKIFEVFQPEIVILSSEDELEDDFIVEKNIIYINGISDAYLSEEKVLKCRNGICDTDLLYTLFTSGSTGIPKGVTICHRSVIDYIEWVENTFCIDDRDVFGNQAPFYFDNSILRSEERRVGKECRL